MSQELTPPADPSQRSPALRRVDSREGSLEQPLPPTCARVVRATLPPSDRGGSAACSHRGPGTTRRRRDRPRGWSASQGTGDARRRSGRSHRCDRWPCPGPARPGPRATSPVRQRDSGSPGTRAARHADRASQPRRAGPLPRALARPWLAHGQPQPHAPHPQHCPHAQLHVAIDTLLPWGITDWGRSPAAR